MFLLSQHIHEDIPASPLLRVLLLQPAEGPIAAVETETRLTALGIALSRARTAAAREKSEAVRL